MEYFIRGDEEDVVDPPDEAWHAREVDIADKVYLNPGKVRISKRGVLVIGQVARFSLVADSLWASSRSRP